MLADRERKIFDRGRIVRDINIFYLPLSKTHIHFICKLFQHIDIEE